MRSDVFQILYFHTLSNHFVKVTIQEPLLRSIARNASLHFKNVYHSVKSVRIRNELLVRIFPHSDWITSNTDIFHSVYLRSLQQLNLFVVVFSELLFLLHNLFLRNAIFWMLYLQCFQCLSESKILTLPMELTWMLISFHNIFVTFRKQLIRKVNLFSTRKYEKSWFLRLQ